MFRTRFLLWCSLFGLVACQQPDSWTVPVTTGISWELASYRATKIGGVAYQLAFNIPEDKTQPIPAQLDLQFVLKQDAEDIQLDFKGTADQLTNLTINEQETPIVFEKEHIILPRTLLKEGKNDIHIDFTAGELGLNRKDDFLYTLLVPDRASGVFPCFDQPNLKGRFSLKLEIPAHWDALANGALDNEIKVDTRKKLTFKETAPISTYLFAFTAGKFQRITRDVGGQEMSMLYRESDVKKVRQNVDEIFALHKTALDWMSGYTAIPLPFEKFDFALIPDFQYNGMEHVGAIFYKASSLMLDENATEKQRIGRASLIAHETAHFWFGDMVTMTWFSDVWLKEVFANFMAAKIVHPRFPAINHDLNFLMSHHPAAYGEDRSQGSHPIQQPLGNLQDAGSLYGRIIYQKAPIVMQQLENLMGDVELRDGLRAYLRHYAYSNASWDDLIALLDERTDHDLLTWSDVWVKSYGMPIYSLVQYVDEDSTSLTLQYQQKSRHDKYWAQATELAVFYPDTILRMPVFMEANRVAANIKLDSFPLAVLAHGSYHSYGYFPMDQRSKTYCLDSVSTVSDPLLRGLMWVSLYEELVHGQLGKRAFLDGLLAALPLETDVLIRDYLLDALQKVYWRFLKPDDRATYTARVENLLRQAYTTAPKPADQLAYFRAFYHTASSDTAMQELLTIWECDQIAPQLPLTESESVDLMAELAIRLPDAADSLLALQYTHIRDPDRRQRFVFLMPALSGKVAVRDSFFQSLKLLENRTTEPWVVDAIGYLHHPLRANDAIRYLPECLGLMEEIQATGDIFFPTQFITAALAGHQSHEAADIVRRFLARRPDYSYRLRNKIWMAADLLYRTSY